MSHIILLMNHRCVEFGLVKKDERQDLNREVLHVCTVTVRSHVASEPLNWKVEKVVADYSRGLKLRPAPLLDSLHPQYESQLTQDKEVFSEPWLLMHVLSLFYTGFYLVLWVLFYQIGFRLCAPWIIAGVAGLLKVGHF